jgi:phage terminase large subunit-like protein
VSVLEVPEVDAEPWPSLGGYVCKWIEENLVFGPGDLLGEPAKLDDEKRYLIWRAYEVFPPGHERAGQRRFTRVGWSLRKGSAKTELAAWIAAVELDRDGPVRCDGFKKNGTPIPRPVRNPYIPMCAYTEEQGEELAYGALREILMRSKSLEGRFDIGIERIIRISRRGDADGKAEAVASAPSARDGARTTFQHFDETHRFVLPSLRKAHQTMLQNIPKRKHADAWSLETTTAYLPGENSVAEGTHKHAKLVSEGRVRNSTLFFFHRQASDNDGATGKPYDLGDTEARKRAVLEASGPVAGWSAVDKIVSAFDDPDVDHTYWERVWLNRPIKGGDKAFDLELWRSRAVPLTNGQPYRPPKGALITLGFDGARYHDATGLVGTEIETGIQFVLGGWEQDPLDPKWQVPQDEVNQTVEYAFSEWTVWRMYCDPPYWESLCADWAGKYGEKVVVYFLTRLYNKMADAVRGFKNAMQDGVLRHDGHAMYERHIGNAHRRVISMRDDQEQPLFVIQKVRPDSPDKIDLATSGVLSWQAAQDARKDGAMTDEANVYNDRAARGEETVIRWL